MSVRSAFQAFLVWLRRGSVPAVPIGPVMNGLPPVVSSADERELARLYLCLRKEIERLATSPEVSADIRDLINVVFEDKHDLANCAAAKATLSLRNGKRCNYGYARSFAEEMLIVSVSATCSTPEKFLQQAHTGRYLASVVELPKVLSQRLDADRMQRLTAVIALEFVIDLEAQAGGSSDFVHSFVTAIPAVVLKNFDFKLSEYPQFHRILCDKRLLTDDEYRELAGAVGFYAASESGRDN